MRLEVQDLAFGYPGKEIGRGVSFALAGGEVLCLLGPNGGGKTTLFKTILRLLAPWHGRVAVDGEAVGGCRACAWRGSSATSRRPSSGSSRSRCARWC